MSANERQVGGTHYAGAYQHWDLVYDADMGYFPAQISRYLLRHDQKNGKEDLEKSLHYVDKHIELLTQGRPALSVDDAVQRYRLAHPRTTTAQYIAASYLAFRGESVEHMKVVRDIITKIIATEYFPVPPEESPER